MKMVFAAVTYMSSLLYRNVLRVTTETLLACFWGNVSPVIVTDTLTSVWTDQESVR